MAQKQKRPSPLEDPPTASSSSESEEEEQQPLSQVKHAAAAAEEELSSEEEGSSEEEEEEEEEETTTTPAPPAVTNSQTKPPQPEPESDSVTQSDSESDTDSDQAPSAPTPNPKIKPLATKPMDQTQTQTLKPKAQPSPAPAKSAAKRPAENTANAGDPKRAKKKAADSAPSAAAGSDEEMEEDGKKSGNDSKKPRLWSDEDEIAILKGLADFIAKTGNDPFKYPEAFYDFVIKSLQVDATRTQVKDKARRLRKKFQTLAGKGKNGETPKFPKAHDQKTFELAKKVWGSGANEAAAEVKPKSNGKPAKSPKKEASSSSKNVASSAKKAKAEARQEPPPPPESDMQVVTLKLSSAKVVDTDVKADSSVLLSEMFRYGVSGLNEDVVKKGLEFIGASKRAELEGRWKKIQVAELELFAKRAQLIDEQARLILEAYKSSEN